MQFILSVNESGRDHVTRRLFLGPYAPCILQGILINCICAVLNFWFFVTRVSFDSFIGLCREKAAFPFSLI